MTSAASRPTPLCAALGQRAGLDLQGPVSAPNGLGALAVRGPKAPPIPPRLRHPGLSHSHWLDKAPQDRHRFPVPPLDPAFAVGLKDLLDRLPRPGGVSVAQWVTRSALHMALSFDPRVSCPEWASACSMETLVQLGEAHCLVLGDRPRGPLSGPLAALAWWLNRPGVLVWAYGLVTRPPPGLSPGKHQEQMRLLHWENAHATASTLRDCGLDPEQAEDWDIWRVAQPAQPPSTRTSDRALPLYVPHYLPPSTRPYPRARRR